MSGYDSSDSSWSDAKARRKSNGVTHQRLKKIGTNVHSSMGGGVSVHNALMALEPPPADAKPGSEHAPWLRLTDWEMMMLRKRMKKNAKWRPSESMVKVELIGFGRGPHNYWEAKKKAEAEGVEFIDVDNIAAADPDKPRAWGEVGLTAPSSSEDIPRNKGMALNEAKKRKRDEFLASASQRSSKNASDDGLPSRKPTALNSVVKRPRGRPPGSKNSPKTDSNHIASQYSKSTLAQIYTESTSDDFHAGDEDDSDGSFDPYALKVPHAKHASEPLLGIQQQQGTPDFQDSKTLPNHIPTQASPGAKTAGVSQHSQKLHGSPISNNNIGFGPGQSSARSEPPVLQQSHDSLPTAAASVHTTVSPQPSNTKRGNPLQQLLFSRPSTAVPTTHAVNDAETSSASPANPLQRLLSSHPSRAISHPQTQSSPLWSDNAGSRTGFDVYTSASPQPSITVPKNTQPPQLYESPSTATTRGPADAIRMPQKRRPGALFDHRESLSKIVGVKRPVPKATHLPVPPPPMMQSPPPMEPPQVHYQSSVTKPAPASKPASASKPGPKPRGKPGPKPKAKPGPKPKPQPAADGPPPKKRKYIPGGPGGGGRYVDL